MHPYIALLRGVNVSGQKKIPMADLGDLLSKEKLENVQTYIQSGNVVFQSLEKKKEILETKIHKAIKSYFGFDVPVLVKSPMELQQIFNDCPFPEEQKINSYFIMLYSVADIVLVDKISKLTYTNEVFKITDNCVYFYYSIGYGKAKFSNNFFERKLKVTATARNYNTMVKLLSLSS